MSTGPARQMPPNAVVYIQPIPNSPEPATSITMYAIQDAMLFIAALLFIVAKALIYIRRLYESTDIFALLTHPISALTHIELGRK